MTNSNRYKTLFVTLVSVALLTSGCATTAKKSAATSTATIQTVSDDYRQAQRQAAATLQAVNALAVVEPEDIKPSFAYLKRNVEMMEQVGQRLLRHAEGMFYRGTFYFVESGKSLQACALPSAGLPEEGRSIDLGPDFYPISDAGGKVKDGLQGFLFDVRQIRNMIADNPTPAGVDSAEKFMDKANVDGEFLQLALQSGITALDRAAKDFPPAAPSTSAPVAPAPPPGAAAPSPVAPQRPSVTAPLPGAPPVPPMPPAPAPPQR